MLRAMVVDAAAGELVEALGTRGLRAVLLKGPALSRWLYDEDALRPYGDADLLVPSRDVATVEATLTERGFALAPLSALPGDFPRHARSWVRPGGGSIDLHVTLPGAEADPEVVWAVLSARTERMRVGGLDVEVLDEPGRATVVALHAAKDGTRVQKVLHDLGHALERVDRSTWTVAAEVAASIGATAAFASGLRCSEAGRALAEALDLPDDRSALVALRAQGPPPLAVGIEWLLTEPSVRRRAVVVARKLVPPPAYLRASSALARRGRVGLALAYVLRPGLMLWRSVPAATAVHRARRGRAVARRGPRWSTPARVGAAGAAVLVAVAWPFTRTANQLGGPVLLRFGAHHGLDLVDLLSIGPLALAFRLLRNGRARRVRSVNGPGLGRERDAGSPRPRDGSRG
jgi:hypothetical protein